MTNKAPVASSAEVITLVMQEARRRGIRWFTEADAAAMVGSFRQETGTFRRDVIEFETRGDQGTAHGLMQWRGQRFTNLISFAKKNNISAKDIRTQISFAFEEGMNGSTYADAGSVRAFREMQGSNTLADKATAFIHAERPAGYGRGNGNPAQFANDRSRRIQYAEQSIGEYTGGEVDLEFLGIQGGHQNINNNGDYDQSSLGQFGIRTNQNAPNGSQGFRQGFDFGTGFENFSVSGKSDKRSQRNVGERISSNQFFNNRSRFGI